MCTWTTIIFKDQVSWNIVRQFSCQWKNTTNKDISIWPPNRRQCNVRLYQNHLVYHYLQFIICKSPSLKCTQSRCYRTKKCTWTIVTFKDQVNWNIIGQFSCQWKNTTNMDISIWPPNTRQCNVRLYQNHPVHHYFQVIIWNTPSSMDQLNMSFII